MAKLANIGRMQRRGDGDEEACPGRGASRHLTSMANLASISEPGPLEGCRGARGGGDGDEEACPGEEHPSTLTSMANLASTYRNQGRWKDAEALEVVVMEMRQACPGRGASRPLTSMANLASTYGTRAAGRMQRRSRAAGRMQRARGGGDGDEEACPGEEALHLDKHGQLHPHIGTRAGKDAEASSMANLHPISEPGPLEGCRGLEVVVMEMRKRVLGEEPSDTLTSMGNLVHILEPGPLEGCRGARGGGDGDEEALSWERSILHLDKHGQSHSTYRNQGRWKDAEALEVVVMEMRKRHGQSRIHISEPGPLEGCRGARGGGDGDEEAVLGEEHPHLASMANLASTYWNQGRWKDAEALEVVVMEMRKRVLGEEHPDTLTSMANLASTYWNQGRWKDAEALEVVVMEMRKRPLEGCRGARGGGDGDEERVLGEEHPDTLTSMANLASTLEPGPLEGCRGARGGGDGDEEACPGRGASFHLDKHGQSRIHISEPGPLEGCRGARGGGDGDEEAGRWKDAEALEVVVMEMRQACPGRGASFHLDKHGQSRIHISEPGPLEGCRGARGGGDGDEEACPGRGASHLDKYGQSRIHISEPGPLEGCRGPRGGGDGDEEARPGRGASRHLASMANLASTYWNQGRWKDAEALEVVVMEMSKRVLGEEHPSTLTSMANLASTYWNQGRWKDAEALEVVVMEMSKRVLGEEHPDTLTSMANLASTYRNQGRWKDAEALEVVVMEMRSVSWERSIQTP
ncbi:hypothetical protein B0H14DRAFT_3145159 [Mycena olivaceomarginata]|nr:hypothetical protein B0H14DRAFT_3145159 [Mycena olivaceomarginata]